AMVSGPLRKAGGFESMTPRAGHFTDRIASRQRGESASPCSARQSTMRPPPAGTVPHTVRVSGLQARTIISRRAGRNGGIGPSETGCAAGAGCGAAAGAVAAARLGLVFLLVAGAVGALGAVAVDGWAAGAAAGVAGDSTGAAGSAGAAVAA